MAEKDSKQVENADISNGKDSGGGKSSAPKKLSANAPVFDVSRSPTLDPYAGPNGIRTLPANVPPATIPPPQTQQQQQQQPPSQQSQQPTQQTQQQQQATQQAQQQHLSRSRQRQGYPQPYDQHDPERDRRNNMSYNPNYQKPMAPQHMRHPQQQYPPQMGTHQRGYPNYPYPGNRGPHGVPRPDYPPHPQMMNRHPNQGYPGRGHPQNPMHQQTPHGYMQPPPIPHQNGNSNNQQPTNGQQQLLASPPQQQQQTNGVTSNNNNNTTSSNNNNNNNSKNTSNNQQSSNALNNGTSNTNGSTSKQQTQQQSSSTTATTTTTTTTTTTKTKPGQVQFKTFTHQKNARPVGSTIAYKHPSRSHYGQPDAKLRDPKFTNPDNLLHLQRWELLESAKRWLPGEGTLITWKNHRYLIGPPIHMGMNGHIHYCYKYPLPKDKRTKKDKTKKDKEDEDDSNGGTTGGDNNNDETDIIDIDITSPCVETLAAKIVPNTPAFAREIVILRALQDCENVTELYDVLESERTLISILELAQADVYNFFVGRGSTRHGWNLDKPAVREHFSKMVISNVVQGLDQMHNVKGGGYLHCDLKSLNILLYIYVTDHSNRRGGVYIKAKLTDFGHSSHGTTRIAEKLFSNGMARVGTAGHVAPELFKEGTKCTEKIDIWSLGIVMFSMLVPGRLLFSEYTNLDALKRGYDRLNKMNPWSRDRPSWWTDFERLSPEARDLILWMTRYDPNQRPTCQQILKHPWFLIGKAGHREHYRPSLKYVDMLCSSSIAQE